MSKALDRNPGEKQSETKSVGWIDNWSNLDRPSYLEQKNNFLQTKSVGQNDIPSCDQLKQKVMGLADLLICPKQWEWGAITNTYKIADALCAIYSLSATEGSRLMTWMGKLYPGRIGGVRQKEWSYHIPSIEGVHVIVGRKQLTNPHTFFIGILQNWIAVNSTNKPAIGLDLEKGLDIKSERRRYPVFIGRCVVYICCDIGVKCSLKISSPGDVKLSFQKNQAGATEFFIATAKEVGSIEAEIKSSFDKFGFEVKQKIDKNIEQSNSIEISDSGKLKFESKRDFTLFKSGSGSLTYSLIISFEFGIEGVDCGKGMMRPLKPIENPYSLYNTDQWKTGFDPSHAVEIIPFLYRFIDCITRRIPIPTFNLQMKNIQMRERLMQFGRNIEI